MISQNICHLYLKIKNVTLFLIAKQPPTPATLHHYYHPPSFIFCLSSLFLTNPLLFSPPTSKMLASPFIGAFAHLTHAHGHSCHIHLVIIRSNSLGATSRCWLEISNPIPHGSHEGVRNYYTNPLS